MDYLNANIAVNLRRIRQSKQMSLENVALETGLSKSMLGQIERGEANPTIGTLGKIISGLRVNFMDLVGAPQEESYVVRRVTLTPAKYVEDAYKNYVYFPYEKERPFEIYDIEIIPGKDYPCSSHGENTQEYLIVTEGELFLEAGGEEYTLSRGDAICFSTDRPHIYYNKGTSDLHLYIVFTWK